LVLLGVALLVELEEWKELTEVLVSECLVEEATAASELRLQRLVELNEEAEEAAEVVVAGLSNVYLVLVQKEVGTEPEIHFNQLMRVDRL